MAVGRDSLAFVHEEGDLVVALDTLLTLSDPVIRVGVVCGIQRDPDGDFGVPGDTMFRVMWPEDGDVIHTGFQGQYSCYQLVPLDLGKRVVWGRAAQVERHMNPVEIARVVTLLNEREE